MDDFAEKRDFGRFDYEAPITYAYQDSDCFFRGKTANHSEDGMFFESDVPLRPGAPIYIRVDSFSAAVIHSEVCCCKGIRTLSRAEVRWCRHVLNASDYIFGVGLKYCEMEF